MGNNWVRSLWLFIFIHGAILAEILWLRISSINNDSIVDKVKNFGSLIKVLIAKNVGADSYLMGPAELISVASLLIAAAFFTISASASVLDLIRDEKFLKKINYRKIKYITIGQIENENEFTSFIVGRVWFFWMVTVLLSTLFNLFTVFTSRSLGNALILWIFLSLIYIVFSVAFYNLLYLDKFTSGIEAANKTRSKIRKLTRKQNLGSCLPVKHITLEEANQRIDRFKEIINWKNIEVSSLLGVILFRLVIGLVIICSGWGLWNLFEWKHGFGKFLIALILSTLLISCLISIFHASVSLLRRYGRSWTVESFAALSLILIVGYNYITLVELDPPLDSRVQLFLVQNIVALMSSSIAYSFLGFVVNCIIRYLIEFEFYSGIVGGRKVLLERAMLWKIKVSEKMNRGISFPHVQADRLLVRAEREALCGRNGKFGAVRKGDSSDSHSFEKLGRLNRNPGSFKYRRLVYFTGVDVVYVFIKFLLLAFIFK